MVVRAATRTPRRRSVRAVTGTWDDNAPGVVVLPSGRAVRGRGLHQPLPPGPVPDFAVHLLGHEPPSVPWPHEWLRWRDFWLPSDVATARETLLAAWARSAGQRVEVACGGGRGRTGTALACLAVVDGVPGTDAVAYIRQHYDHRAVEMPWQRRFIARFYA